MEYPNSKPACCVSMTVKLLDRHIRIVVAIEHVVDRSLWPKTSIVYARFAGVGKEMPLGTCPPACERGGTRA
jgi:hypothetical protein